jgi:hypothetical protein
MFRPKSLPASVGLAAMALLAMPPALLAYTYLFGHVPPDVVVGNRFWPRLLPVHASFGATALLLGFLQFIPRIRNRHPAVHRWTGRTYVTCCLLGGAAGLILAFGAPTGAVTTFGFGSLALLWLGTTAIGWRMAWLDRTAVHRRWMIRSFAMTFAFVTFRVELQLGFLLGLPFETSYQISAVLCSITNLLVAEIIIRRGPARPRRTAAPA